jgi:pSer/pThr/pTyr-binding forkhead associated (FHA) protein
MQKVTLYIETAGNSQTVSLEDELSLGRTTAATIALDDTGLSRVNTTIFRDGDVVYVVDEGSLNGTFLNGQRLGSNPERLLDGDVLTLGSETKVQVEFGQKEVSAVGSGSWQTEAASQNQKQKAETQTANPKSKIQNPKLNAPPMILILAVGSAFFIIFIGVIGVFIASRYENQPKTSKGKTPPKINQAAVIPIRVRDPFGGQSPEDLQELVQYWEVQEEDVEATDLQDITVSSDSGGTKTAADLKVSVEFWQQQKAKALAARSAPTGNDPPGTQVPRELFGDGVIKQKAKLREMLSENYQQPMDFAELAQKRLSGELVELPMATESYIVEVGGSASEAEFTSFNFAAPIAPITPGSPKYNTLQQLANNFAGEKYDLNNPSHRKQMRIRLLRMFHPRSKPILERLAKAYHAKFNRPLRLTSLSRSMDYQISLNRVNPNSFVVRGPGSLPPHTSGCAFDLARKHMTAEEQNFVMAELAQMEREGILDALREGNLNACFHVFIYDDGLPPKM